MGHPSGILSAGPRPPATALTSREEQGGSLPTTERAFNSRRRSFNAAAWLPGELRPEGSGPASGRTALWDSLTVPISCRRRAETEGLVPHEFSRHGARGKGFRTPGFFPGARRWEVPSSQSLLYSEAYGRRVAYAASGNLWFTTFCAHVTSSAHDAPLVNAFGNAACRSARPL
jgi:hypothetical protein